MENTWGVCPASFGTNLSAMPAATMWAGMYPMTWQDFQCSIDKTPPLQAHDRLADVLDEIGIPPANGSPTILDIKAFTESLAGRPIYSRSMLRNAADQLPRARRGQDVTLFDCYGKTVVVPGGKFSSSAQGPILAYKGIHMLTENFQADGARDMLPVSLEPGKPAKESTHHVADTNHVLVDQFGPSVRIIGDPDILPRAILKHTMDAYEPLWDKSDTNNGPRAKLHKSLRKLVHTARISNIVCIGLGTLDTSDPMKAGSIVQHIVASFIAEDLAELYEAEGIPLQDSIRIIAQDPAYTDLDRLALSQLPVPIEVVTDPEAFLAIDEHSLVFSSYPSVPVKQLIADLATETPGGKGPAALFLNSDREDKFFGDFDVVKYRRNDPQRYANAETKAYVKMLESYTRVLDGERRFGIAFNYKRPGFEWLSGMDIWGRED